MLFALLEPYWSPYRALVPNTFQLGSKGGVSERGSGIWLGSPARQIPTLEVGLWPSY